MAAVELSQFDIDKSILESAVDENGVRKYTDAEIEALRNKPVERASAVKAEKAAILVKTFREENDKLPNEEKLTESEIATKVSVLLSQEEEGSTEIPEPTQGKDQAGGVPVPEDANFPVPAPTDGGETSSAAEQLAILVREQILEPTIPPLVPVGSLSEMDVFIEPISRLMFVLVVANPTGFFYTGINVPCAYPIVVPPFYPVTMVGKAPAGVLTLAFMDTTLPVCTGSEEANIELLAQELEVDALSIDGDPDVVPCDMDLAPSQYLQCVRELNRQMRNKLAPIELTPQLKALIDQIEDIAPSSAPDVTPPDRSTQSETEIIVEDGVDGLFEGINVIE